MFRQFDADNSGSVDIKEIRHMLQILGQNPTKSEVRELVKEFDDNRNYINVYINFADAVVKSHRQRHYKFDLFINTYSFNSVVLNKTKKAKNCPQNWPEDNLMFKFTEQCFLYVDHLKQNCLLSTTFVKKKNAFSHRNRLDIRIVNEWMII